MFRNIVLACAAALGLGFASYAGPATEALAASAIKKPTGQTQEGTLSPEKVWFVWT
jgi:hypothetical protein